MGGRLVHRFRREENENKRLKMGNITCGECGRSLSRASDYMDSNCSKNTKGTAKYNVCHNWFRNARGLTIHHNKLTVYPDEAIFFFLFPSKWWPINQCLACVPAVCVCVCTGRYASQQIYHISWFHYKVSKNLTKRVHNEH